ncbi:phosphoesterase [Niabella ginsenosidivorans]|uniref:Phosphoesterase n=1 Tax=Niabella ginsenosidivorans TaxID=1176587 RepID=A0A1A9I7G8_9BACT|nr:phosphatase PAP2 family protein [Niabella ginsenosidivorans]ANH82650.1 phosphoesterase [Niabella ginsenosidivorans]
MKILAGIFFFLSCSARLLAQQQDSTAIIKDSLPAKAFTGIHPDELPSSGSRILPKNFILPAALITIGALGDGTHIFNGLNKTTKDEIVEDHPNFSTHIDNVMQYAPAAVVFGLQALGMKGRNSVPREALLYAMALGINGAFVSPLKHLTREERPDGSNHYSFPSGHTSTAFASAEFLRREYKDVSPWYGVGGYAVAAATGILRMYNNRHWLGDVVAGAGFGIASTNLSYLIFNQFHMGNKRNKEHKTIYCYPRVADGTYGLGMIKIF